MAGLQAFNETHPGNESIALDNAVGTTHQQFDPPLSTDWRLDMLIATNTDAIDHVVDVYYKPSGAEILLTSQNVPAGAGLAGAPAVNLLAGLPAPYNAGLPLNPLDAITVANEVSATVSGAVNIVAMIATL
jgi:hypothetical protein